MRNLTTSNWNLVVAESLGLVMNSVFMFTYNLASKSAVLVVTRSAGYVQASARHSSLVQKCILPYVLASADIFNYCDISCACCCACPVAIQVPHARPPRVQVPALHTHVSAAHPFLCQRMIPG